MWKEKSQAQWPWALPSHNSNPASGSWSRSGPSISISVVVPPTSAAWLAVSCVSLAKVPMHGR